MAMTAEMSDALYKIGEGFQDLSRAIASQAASDPVGGEQPAPIEELDISGDTTEGRRRRQAIVLRALEKAEGRLHKDDFYKIAQSVGYDNRGLAGFSTTQANLVEVERQNGAETGYRVLTETGRHRLEINRRLLPPE
jgi:hypothetical protein